MPEGEFPVVVLHALSLMGIDPEGIDEIEWTDIENGEIEVKVKMKPKVNGIRITVDVPSRDPNDMAY